MDFEQLLDKARAAQRGGDAAWSVQSTGEKLAVALILNRADWLAAMDYTIAEAIERLGAPCVALIPRAARALRETA